MRSSISNSETANAVWGIRLLLLVVITVIVAMEVGARLLVPLVNRNMRRFQTECANATSPRQPTDSAEFGILLLGNSLTRTDIDLGVLGDALGITRGINQWAIDDTYYLDWYYGLRRAFRGGARPKLVLIGARSSHLLAQRVRGRFFAHYILECEDLPDAALRTGVNLNGVCSMALAQVSAFYGSREETFKRCLTLALPDFPRLGRMMAPKRQNPGVSTSALSIFLVERFAELRDLCVRNGSQVIIWIPPAPSQVDPLVQLIVESGRRAKLPVILPGNATSWKDIDFQDGDHMTQEASKRFTSLLAKQLQPHLTRLKSSQGLALSEGGAITR